MRNPATLPHSQLVEIATGLQRILYGRQDEKGRWSYSSHKQWSGGDVCEATAELLGRFDLVPDSEGDGQPMDDQ
jgi:hypothetical protein